MPRFRYEALNAQHQPTSGVLEATSLAAAVTELEKAELTVQSIAQATDGGEGEPSPVTPDPELIAAVQRVFAVRDNFLDPLAAYVSELPPSKRRRQLKAIQRTLEQESTDDGIAAATREPLSWAPLLAACSLAEGDDGVFARFVDRERSKTSAQRKRGVAMAYPLFIGGLTLLVGWPIAVFLLPTFRDIYESFGLELPLLTEAVLSVGRLFENGTVYFLLLLAGLLYLIWVTLAHWAPRWLVRLGNLVAPRGGSYSIESAKLTRAGANLIEAGLSPAYALSAAGDAVGGHAGDNAQQLSAQLADTTAKPTATSGPLAFAFTHPMSASKRATVLRDLGNCHEEHTLGSDSMLGGFAGPAATVAVGVLVGVVVLALFLPLVRLVQGLT